ncbi:hypothetical protein Hrd1104_02905 [Halorhabdus sp. CBA1104]|uniref:hypothetical protein n=1 Tax=unclassified Halorhabdus TaxID=2621901 RepID=UPI0012B27ECF|nr:MULTISPECIES: hypothetical protein [unclassified Halorhabdus]QGN06346.1 hypothetical protein Hrd1104_02905 [Halorhabdus sp. CBA1104]
MFDSIQELPDTALGNVAGAGSVSDPIDGLLREHEQPRTVLVGESVEYTTGERTTTVEPDGEYHTYLIATDERVLVVLGEQPSECEIEFELPSISRAAVNSGLLNTTLVVEQGDQSIRVSPTHGDAQAVAEYITVMAEAYTDVEDAIASAKEMTEELETKVREGGKIGYLRLQVQSELSDARQSVTREAVQTDRLLERVETTETELNRRYADAWIDRVRDTVGQAETALDQGEYAAFCEAYVEATDGVASLQDVLADLDSPSEEVTSEAAEMDHKLEEFAERYVESTREAHENATESDDPAVTANCWLETYRRVRAARDAGWATAVDSCALPLSEIEPIAEATVDALEHHADTLQKAGEQELETDAAEARRYFEQGVTRMRQAHEIVDTQPVGDSAAIDQRLTELKEKVEVTEWEWGTD